VDGESQVEHGAALAVHVGSWLRDEEARTPSPSGRGTDAHEDVVASVWVLDWTVDHTRATHPRTRTGGSLAPRHTLGGQTSRS
jgi:hypothetical protein